MLVPWSTRAFMSGQLEDEAALRQPRALSCQVELIIWSPKLSTLSACPCGGLTWTAGPWGRVAELLFAFLKNRGFGKKWVSNFTKSPSVVSGFFRVLLLPCGEGEKGES